MALFKNVTKSPLGSSLYQRIFSRTAIQRGCSSSNDVGGGEQMSLIKQVRVRTSAPIKEIKAALVDCQWDIDAAQKKLRKRGMIVASKKSSRTAAEGLLALATDGNKAAVIELNCETDFVARNDIFQHLNPSDSVSGIFPVGPDSLEELKLNLDHPKISGETTVKNAITEVAAMMGENVRFRSLLLQVVYFLPTSMQAPSLEGENVDALTAEQIQLVLTIKGFTKSAGLGRIAGILSLEAENGNALTDAVQRVGSELAMHIVAAKPVFLTKELVSVDALENEREILKSQQPRGNPKMAIERMVEGRLCKYMEDVVLMEQKFVVNDSFNVKTLLDNLSKEIGSSVRIGNFFKVEVGEGIQRDEATNASEPMAQVV